MRRELLLLSCCVVIPSICSAQEKSDTTMVEKKAERNVMLNASDANAPRYIQIGLPSEDVNVYENGLPVVYSSNMAVYVVIRQAETIINEATTQLENNV